MLNVKNIDAGYSNVNVLFGLSMHVDAGACVAVLGPNGAGKSTLLRAISGFVKLSSGEIKFEGNDIGGMETNKTVAAGISHVMQGRQVLAEMSVRDNLLLGGHLTYGRAGRAEVARGLDEVYSLFPILAERRLLPAAALSGGEQQMLAIGRALMARPKLLLLDEPSMGLAPLIIKQIHDVLAAIKATGMSMVLVEQNPDFALGLADYCYVMEGGKTVLEGSPDILKSEERMMELYLGAW